MAKRKAPGAPPSAAVVPEQIERSILFVRGDKVLPDSQLAEFYRVPTKALVQAVKRNLDRFPADFMFQLTNDEWDILKSQTVTSSLRSQSVTLKPGVHGGRRTRVYAFTEQGVAMLSGVLRSPRAVEVNKHPNHAGVCSAAAIAGNLSRIGGPVGENGAFAANPRQTHQSAIPPNFRCPGGVVQSTRPTEAADRLSTECGGPGIMTGATPTPHDHHGQFAESAKQEQAIQVNLRELGYGS